MARVDPMAAAAQRKRTEAYEDLKAGLREGAMLTDALGGTVPMRPINHKAAYEYLEQQEQRIDELELHLGDYQKFFKTMQDLLPKQRSIHDKIG